MRYDTSPFQQAIAGIDKHAVGPARKPRKVVRKGLTCKAEHAKKVSLHVEQAHYFFTRDAGWNFPQTSSILPDIFRSCCRHRA